MLIRYRNLAQFSVAIIAVGVLAVTIGFIVVVGTAISLILAVILAALCFFLKRWGIGAARYMWGYFLWIAMGLGYFELIRSLSALGVGGTIGLTVVMGVIVVWVYLRRGEKRRRRWATAGLCENCGYDLRASSDVCPECGAPLPEELLRRRRIAMELRKTNPVWTEIGRGSTADQSMQTGENEATGNDEGGAAES